MQRPAKGVDPENEFLHEHQSTTWGTNLKTLFSEFKSYGIIYSYPSDFDCDKGFVAVQNKRFEKIAKKRLDFGAKPNCGKTDMSVHEKVDAALQDYCLQPETNFQHLLWLVHWFLGCYFMLRGGIEHIELVWGMLFSLLLPKESSKDVAASR